MKKLLGYVMVICMVFALLPAGNVSAETSGYYTYTVSNGLATITDVDESISGDIVMPSKINGYTVETIGAEAFKNCTELVSIIIPDSVTTIGYSSFAFCTNLQTVSIPNSVTTIGANAFYFCKSIKSLNIPNSVTTICEGAFGGCTSLEDLTMPKDVYGDGVASRFGYIFGYETEVTTKQYYSIDEYLYYHGEYINPTVTYPEIDTAYTNGNKVPNGTTYQQYNYTYTSSKVEYPAGIGNGYIFFYSHRVYVYYHIPKSLKRVKITNDTSVNFYNCTNIEEVILSEDITTIGSNAFYNCTSLKNVKLHNPDTSTNSAFGVECNIIRTNNENIGDDKFYYIINEDNTAEIVDSETTSTAITIPLTLGGVKVTKIGDSGFRSCKTLASVTITNYITDIGSRAFYGCTTIEDVIMPDSIISIGEEAFGYCNSLTNVYYGGNETDWENISIESYNTALANAIIHYNYIGTAEISPLSCTYSNSKLSANITLDNNITKACSMMFAIYNGNKLVCIKEYPVAVGQTSVPVEFTTDENYTGYTAKAFCIDGLKGLASLSNAVTAEIQ